MRKILVGAAILLALVLAGFGGVLFASHQAQTNLDAALARLPPGLKITHGAVWYLPILDRLTIEDMREDRDGTVPIHLAEHEVVVTGANPDLFQAWAAAARGGSSPDLAIPVAERLSVERLTLKQPTVEGTFQHAEIAGLRLRPWPLYHPGAISAADIAPAFTPGQKPDQVALWRWIQLRAELGLAIAYDCYDVSSATATVRVPEIGKTPAETDHMSIDDSRSLAFDRGRSAGGHVDGIRYEYPAGTVTVAHASIGAFDIADSQQIVTSSEAAPATLSGLGLTQGPVAFSGIAFQRPAHPPIALGSIASDGLTLAGGSLVKGGMSWTGIHLARSDFADLARGTVLFDALGLDALDAGYNFSVSRDAARHDTKIDGLHLKIDQLGSADLTVDLPETGDAARWADRVALGHATLLYRDGSLIQRLIAYGAERQNIPPDAYREQIIAMVDATAMSFGNVDAIRNAAKAVAAFLASPRSLTVEFAPPAPIPLKTLGQMAKMPPAQAVPALGVTVKAGD